MADIKSPFDSLKSQSPFGKGSPGIYDTEPGYDDRTSTKNGPPQKLYDLPSGAATQPNKE